MSIAFIFPGQGSQTPGMGHVLYDHYPEAKSVFQEVDEALGQNLSGLMFDGPENELTLTANAQPAIMSVSMAVVRVLESHFGIAIDRASYLAGHSLGEYSALCAAGVFSLSDTARLLRTRGQAMQACVPPGEGAMAALLGPKADINLAQKCVDRGAQHGVCVIANDNNIGQIVISGAVKAIEVAIEEAKSLGAKAALLNVSAPFHCPLMQGAADAMQTALATVDIKEASVPIIANVTAKPNSDPSIIRSQLVEQVTGRVRWRESIQYLSEGAGVSTFAELGAGKVLTGMVKRLAPNATAMALNEPSDFEAFATQMQI